MYTLWCFKWLDNCEIVVKHGLAYISVLPKMKREGRSSHLLPGILPRIQNKGKGQRLGIDSAVVNNSHLRCPSNSETSL
jgi:hypothetical protein